MALPNINFVKSTSGLGRALPGTDYISGYAHYYPSGGTLPTGFTSSDRIKKIFSVADAENLGITNTSLGATASTATDTITTKFTAGDTFKITCNTIDGVRAGVPITLCNFTAVAADSENRVSLRSAGRYHRIQIVPTGADWKNAVAVDVDVVGQGIR